MSKSRSIFTAAILVAGLLAGCGGSSNHAAAWTKADASELEGELSNAGGTVGQLRPCITKYVEHHVSPSQAKKMGSSSGEALAKAAVSACLEQEAASTSDHSSQWTDAEKQELENVLTASDLSNLSCYTQFIESHVPPVLGKTELESKVRAAMTEASTQCKPAEEREKNESLEAEYKEQHGESTPGLNEGE